jgi:hypothetical protein
VEKKYRALRILTWVYRIIAILVFLGGVGLGILNATSPTIEIDYSNLEGIEFIYGPPNPYPGIGLAIGSAITALTLYAFGELLHLFIDVEENTRHTGRMVSRMARTNTAITKLPSDDDLEEPSIEGLVRSRRK